MKYVGLTDDPERSRKQHGNPPDWWVCRFESEQTAVQWQEDLRALPGYQTGPAPPGACYGYTYTITSSTRQ